MGGYRAEQPVHLAVDPVGELEDIGAAVAAADPEFDRPQAARRVAARIDRDRSM
jgi:hypothetical protein